MEDCAKKDPEAKSKVNGMELWDQPDRGERGDGTEVKAGRK